LASKRTPSNKKRSLTILSIKVENILACLINFSVQGETKDDKGPVVPLELSQMEKYAEKVNV
jgi:hypothetical protein